MKLKFGVSRKGGGLYLRPYERGIYLENKQKRLSKQRGRGLYLRPYGKGISFVKKQKTKQ